VVLDDDDASKDALGIHADQDLDRPVVRALEGLSRSSRRRAEQRLTVHRLEMRRISAFGENAVALGKSFFRLPSSLDSIGACALSTATATSAKADSE